MLSLNLGCGFNKLKFGVEVFEGTVIHLDKNPACDPTMVWDLEMGLPTSVELPDHSVVKLDNSVDEIHAYHIIEHIGKMGETESWLRFWRDCWRALKPYGSMFILTPHYLDEMAVGDPSHTRLISPATFVFLDYKEYKKQVCQDGTPMSDFKIDFDLPVANMEFLKEKSKMFPTCIRAELTARKTQDGKLVDVEKELEVAAK